MEIILNGRRCGKTTKAIKIVKEFDGILVVINRQEKERLIRENLLPEKNIATWDELIKGATRGTTSQIVIDNVDMMLQNMCNGKCAGITINKENAEE